MLQVYFYPMESHKEIYQLAKETNSALTIHKRNGVLYRFHLAVKENKIKYLNSFVNTYYDVSLEHALKHNMIFCVHSQRKLNPLQALKYIQDNSK